MLQRQRRGSEALAAFRELLVLAPGDPELWYEFGYLLKSEGLYQDALDAFGKSLECGVTRPEEVHLNRGVLLSDYLRRDDDAEHELLTALSIAPEYVPALLNLGNLQEERGQREDALETYARLLSGPPSAHPEHNQLRMEGLARSAQLRPATTLEDPLLTHLQQAADAQDNRIVRADLLFALGHSYDRLGAYDLAFDAFARANRWLLRNAGRRYDHRDAARTTDALIAAFQQPLSAASAAVCAAQRPEPLFICGMFRSGSTLIEQVLAAHPEITAGGELHHLRRLAQVQPALFPASLSALTPAQLSGFADDYRAHLARLFPQGMSGTYITDKRPDNFVLIGLIQTLFPGAKIVHTVRNPLDTGLSIFSHHLHPEVAGYACDLTDIGHYFGEYRRLMAHWKSVYPDSILDFDYDAFVADPLPELRRLLDFLGLPWHEGCLDFHRSTATVKTASYWQIRQPLHGQASGRWRRYESQLEPLREALDEASQEGTPEGTR